MELRTRIMTEVTKSSGGRLPKKTRKKKKAGEPATHEISIEMAERGMTVEDIAKERQLVKSTIEGHLTKGVESGRISIYKFMNEPDVEKIAAVVKEMPEEFSSKDLYTALNGKYSYGQLKAVVSHMSKK